MNEWIFMLYINRWIFFFFFSCEERSFSSPKLDIRAPLHNGHFMTGQIVLKSLCMGKEQFLFGFWKVHYTLAGVHDCIVTEATQLGQLWKQQISGFIISTWLFIFTDDGLVQLSWFMLPFLAIMLTNYFSYPIWFSLIPKMFHLTCPAHGHLWLS